MKRSRFPSAAALAAEERRQREDAAPRLRDEVPALSSLRLEFESFRGDTPIHGTRHTKIVVVARAPAVFEVSCGESKCQDGGYDLTREIVNALRSKERQFSGTVQCQGHLGQGYCDRTLHFVGTADYDQ